MKINLSEVHPSDFNRKIGDLLPMSVRQQTRDDEVANIVIYARQTVEILVARV